MKNKLVYIVLFVGFCVNMFACSDGKGEALLPEPIPNPTPAKIHFADRKIDIYS